MTAKKYLSLDEAASLLGVKPDDMVRLREQGEIRGFADRGTWKFKSEDVLELQRRRQTDSSPDVPLMADDESSGQSVFEDEGSHLGLGSPYSDSDVRLVGTGLGSSLAGSSADLPVVPESPRSDSDIRLVGAEFDSRLALPPQSDSDVKLVKNPASGVKLKDSDSDVRLKSGPDSDSDVKLIDPTLANKKGSDSDVTLVGGGSLFSDDDDDSLTLPADSGIRLGSDSGLGLRRAADSGILLEGASSFGPDSGLRLAGDSSKKLAGGAPTLPDMRLVDDLETTAPMYALKKEVRTDPVVPMFDMGDDTETIPSLDDDHNDTSVVMFDDEGSSEIVVGGGSSIDELDTEDAIDGDIEISDDMLSDEDEDLEFGVDDEDFDDGLASGASHAEFATSGMGFRAPQREQEWEGWVFGMMAASTAVLVLTAVVAGDLLQAVFVGGGQTYSGLASTFSGLFGSN